MHLKLEDRQIVPHSIQYKHKEPLSGSMVNILHARTENTDEMCD